MSVRERWLRRARRGKTAEELHRGRCALCMSEIGPREAWRPAARGSGRAHVTCPPWPPGGR